MCEARIFVYDEYWNIGAATAIIKHLFDAVRTKEIGKVYLSVSSDDHVRELEACDDIREGEANSACESASS